MTGLKTPASGEVWEEVVKKQIELEDQLCQDTEWTVDQEIHNYASHMLRALKAKVLVERTN